ncbi:AI-2E family transporter [Paeniglutamicibacter antarcticus]|uniref:AI-2E family transporter n=1 Tax=Arthrobacter terrae TaxID=2935737 RepID=A0A931CR66_9MICC|nr:AI-2E family transporter [Arthrobacter terrae]MBG0740661.1 AI-2E family transporter [Arthrobacter terrae]
MATASRAGKNDRTHRPHGGIVRLPGVVPASLVVAAGWCWRLLVVAGAFLALSALFTKLYLVVLPVFFALLLAALLHPLVALLRRLRFTRPLATWITIVVALVVLGGVGWFVERQASANYASMVNQVEDLFNEAKRYVDVLPGTNSDQLQQLQQQLVDALRKNSQTIASGVITVGTAAVELITGLIVTLFLTFFFLDEGDRIWSWLVRLFPASVQVSVRGAGYRAWHVLSGWVVGTAIIALIHGVVIGLVLFFLGVPLAVPLAVLVFIGSFIPIIGAFLFGGLAVLVALITQGPVAGLIMLAVLIVEDQLEAHLFQPLIVGRAVKLHPVVIVLSLTGGALVAGVFGAILAIPIVASVHASVKYLTGVEDLHGQPRRAGEDRMKPEPPAEYAPLPLYANRSAETGRDGKTNNDLVTSADGPGADGPGADGPGADGAGDEGSSGGNESPPTEPAEDDRPDPQSP